MPDLTPQLRTRLNRMERWVGMFVALAALLLVSGFAYYLHRTATRKGWFLQRVPYYVYVRDATGLKPGDAVKLMGFDIGHITEVTPMPPTQWFVENQYNVFVQFEVIEPNYGYIWTDSRVKVSPSDFLGNRLLEVVKGQTGAVTVVERDGRVTDLLSEHVADTYVAFTNDAKGVWLEAAETPAVAERVDRLFEAIQTVMPAVTNHLVLTLSRSAETLSNLNRLALDAQPVVTNLADITGSLREPQGSLGRWLFPTNFPDQLGGTLSAATQTLAGIDSNLLAVVGNLTVSLDHLANLTSNLNRQVHANSNVLEQISSAVVASDELIQGLKRHWFLRGAFKTKTNRPPSSTTR